jgi:D-sedoheptulose 7-phosphate isomerase
VATSRSLLMDLAKRRLRESADATERLLADPVVMDQVARMLHIVESSVAAGGKLLLCGNGGSACDALHIAEELLGRFRAEGPPWPALCLGTNLGAVTAIANDYSYEEVFRREVLAFGAPGDVLVAISTSGRSANVLAAVQAARQRGMRTVGLTGQQGGVLGEVVDVAVTVPSTDTAHVQEVHGAIGHVVAEVAERAVRARQADA